MIPQAASGPPADTDALIEEARHDADNLVAECPRRFARQDYCTTISCLMCPPAKSLRSLADTLTQEREARKKHPCNLCGEPWPNHAEACSYAQTARALERAEAQTEVLEERVAAALYERAMQERRTCLSNFTHPGPWYREPYVPSLQDGESRWKNWRDDWRAEAREALASLSPPQENQEGPTYDPAADPDHGIDGSGDAALA